MCVNYGPTAGRIVDAENPLLPANRMSETVTRVPPAAGSIVQNGNRVQGFARGVALERDGERDPHDAPRRGLAEGDRSRVAMEDEQVEREHRADDDGKEDPRGKIGRHEQTSG